jgi:hypothetical protein
VLLIWPKELLLKLPTNKVVGLVGSNTRLQDFITSVDVSNKIDGRRFRQENDEMARKQGYACISFW